MSRQRAAFPQITSAMVALAWAILHGPADGATARALAQMVLEAAEASP